MMAATVLVDTSVWSLAYRRRPSSLSPADLERVEALRRLAAEDLAWLIGPIRFEVLSGIREAARFEKVRGYMEAFGLLPLEPATYDLAAECYNRCRGAGVAPGGIDMLICAAAIEHAAAILTLDRDFPHYARILPIRLHALCGAS